MYDGIVLPQRAIHKIKHQISENTTVGINLFSLREILRVKLKNGKIMKSSHQHLHTPSERSCLRALLEKKTIVLAFTTT